MVGEQTGESLKHCGGLSSAPPIPAGIRSFWWNSGGFRNLHRNVPRNDVPRNDVPRNDVPRNGLEYCSLEWAGIEFHGLFGIL